jgi:glutamyl-tRNA synthetase
MGYLPVAMRNYLVRLGWAHGDQEIFSTEEMLRAFDLPAIGRSPARFDFAKLDSLNAHYMRQYSDEELVAEIERALPHLNNGLALLTKMTPALRAKLVAAMGGLKERAKTLVELVDAARYLYADRPLALEDKAQALLTSEARALLGELARDLARLDPWTANTTEATVRALSERANVKLGAIAQPLRAALTGKVTSPGIFDVLAVLGKAESLARLGDQIVAPRSR